MKDIEKYSGSSSSSTASKKSSLPASRQSQVLSLLTSSRGPKLVKLGVNDLADSKSKEEATVLRVDEISKDGCRLHRRELDISELSPVKRRRETLDRSRTVGAYEPVPASLSDTLRAVLQDYSASGFEYVPDSRALPNVECLMAAAAAKHSKRRYLSSVMFSFNLSLTSIELTGCVIGPALIGMEAFRG